MRASLLDNLIWGILLLLLIPSGLVLASWDSLPGSMLYKTKLTMEQALVVVMPSYEAKGSLQVAYTERRFSDAKRMLADKSSVEGLAYLNEQVVTTKLAIRNAPNTEVKRELAQKYIATLQSVNTQLEEQQQIHGSSGANQQQERQPARLSTSTPTPTRIPTQPSAGVTVIPATPTHTPSPIPTIAPTAVPAGEDVAPADVDEEIDNTQREIEETIDELEQLSQASSVETQAEEREKDRGKDREKGRDGGRDR